MKDSQRGNLKDSTDSQNDRHSNNNNLNLLALNSVDEVKSKHLCVESTNTQVLSRVGPYVSKEIDVNTKCAGGTHPSDSHEFRTIDSTAGGKSLNLTDLFKKEDIYDALMNDKIVQSALSSVHAHPKNFEELQKTLNIDDGLGIGVYQERPGKDPVDIYLNNHILSNFAFHHMDGNKVAVRLLPDFGSEAARNKMTQLGIDLPIPAGMEDAFANASGGNGGFLMKDSRTKGTKTSNHRNYLEED